MGTCTHVHPHARKHIYIYMHIHMRTCAHAHTTYTHAHARAHTHTSTAPSRSAINVRVPLLLPGPRITAASDRTFAIPTSSGKHVGTETRCLPLLFSSIRIFLLTSKGLEVLACDTSLTALSHNCCCSRPILCKCFLVISIAFARRGFAVDLICDGSHEKFNHSFISRPQSSLRVFHDKYTCFSRLPMLCCANRYTGNENPFTPLDFGGLNLPRTVGSGVLIIVCNCYGNFPKQQQKNLKQCRTNKQNKQLIDICKHKQLPMRNSRNSRTNRFLSVTSEHMLYNCYGHA